MKVGSDNLTYEGGPSNIFRPITWVPAVGAGRPVHDYADGGLLIPLNAPFQAGPPPNKDNGVGMPGPLVQGPHALRPATGPKNKRLELFREEDVQLQWSSVTRAGAGLQNLGNTCFMNSVLQCLAHTPPLAEAVLNGRAQCPASSSSSDDPLAITLAHIRRVFSSHGIVRPAGEAKVLRTVNKRFRPGRQEDSHEYLRCLLDALHEACLKPFKPKPPPHLAATTFINRIFGARLRSRIKCHGVDYESSTYETFMDLSLEINRAKTVTRALQHFTAKETLDGDNKYRCPKNNKLVRAEKQITIEEAPNVLTIHLKRFQFGGMGSKITKPVDYDKEMNLQPFMSRPECGPQWYDLYGVLVHLGHSVHSGHYYCFVRAGNGMWHKCDDTWVGQCSERTVLGQQAYILFYVRRHPRTPTSPRPGPASQPHADDQQTNASPASTARAAATANGGSHTNGPAPSSTPAANGVASRAARAAGSRGTNGTAANGATANGGPKAVQPRSGGAGAAEGAAQAADGALAGAKRSHADSTAAAAGNGVDGGVLLPPSKRPRGGKGELRGSRVGEGLQQQQQFQLPQPSSSAGPSHAVSGQGRLQGNGEACSPSNRLSPSAHPASSSRPATQPRAHHLARIAAQLTRCHPNSGLTSHLSAHLSMQQGHRNQRHARELRARSRTEVKLHRGQPQPQLESEQDGVQGEGVEPAQQDGRQGSHQHASTSAAGTDPSSQPQTSPAQRQRGRSVKLRPLDGLSSGNGQPGVQQSGGMEGGENQLQQQRHQSGPQQQQQQQQQGAGEQVLVGAEAVRLLGAGVGGAGLGRGKPASMQPWPDVDPGVAIQQESALSGARQQKHSRQLDMWDEEYDAGKTKKVRSKDRAGADLHAGGNAFQAFQQHKHGRGGMGSSEGKHHGSKGRNGFGGGGRGRGRRGGRGGGRFPPQTQQRG